MTLIEGVGDEVIHFFLLLAIVLIVLIAWWSTNLSERPLIRTVFIVERRTIRRTPADVQTITNDVTDTNNVLEEGSEVVEECKTSQSNTGDESQNEVSMVRQLNESEPIPNSESPPEDSIEGNEDSSAGPNSEESNETVVRNRRLAFFESRQEPRPAVEEVEYTDVHTSCEIESSHDSGLRNRKNSALAPAECERENKDVEKMNLNCSPTVDVLQDNASPSECETESSNEGNIRIRLKYLNDDQKLVEGKLQEQLGDFKRRHFSLELAGRKLVRLIFKGQVLQEDTKTLQNCGFFDNCVVHCLVHSRTPPPSPSLYRPRNENHTNNDNTQHWDLGNILFVSLSLLLGLAWYGRYQYPQLYTATTTVALVGLTGIFTVSFIGMYMPDTDGVRT